MEQTVTLIRQTLSAHYPHEEVRAMVRLIMEKCFGCSPLEIYMGRSRAFSQQERQRAAEIAERAANGEPIQYILGEADFGSLTFAVRKGALIPRPETTELTGWIVDDHRSSPPRSLLDIGAGSGCIAITLAKAFPSADVSAWDISPAALAVAAENSERHGVRVALSLQDMLMPFPTEARYDVIVSNPPYVTLAEREEMEANVLDWEPAEALFVPDSDPLLFYRRLAEIGQSLLSPQGALYVEVNRAYGEATANLFRTMGYCDVSLRHDLSGHPRMVKAKRL